MTDDERDPRAELPPELILRPQVEDIGLLIALCWAQRSTCLRRKVGCYLADRDHRVVSHGYNGAPSGMPHCIDTPCPGANAPSGTMLDACQAIHAEANALLAFSDTRRIDTCYVTTSPCVPCVKMLLGTGCRRIVFIEHYLHPEAEAMWRNAGRAWVRRIPPVAATMMATLRLLLQQQNGVVDRRDQRMIEAVLGA